MRDSLFLCVTCLLAGLDAARGTGHPRGPGHVHRALAPMGGLRLRRWPSPNERVWAQTVWLMGHATTQNVSFGPVRSPWGASAEPKVAPPATFGHFWTTVDLVDFGFTGPPRAYLLPIKPQNYIDTPLCVVHSRRQPGRLAHIHPFASPSLNRAMIWLDSCPVRAAQTLASECARQRAYRYPKPPTDDRRVPLTNRLVCPHGRRPICKM